MIGNPTDLPTSEPQCTSRPTEYPYAFDNMERPALHTGGVAGSIPAAPTIFSMS